MAHRNFARGSAPPAHSWEWVGVEHPPGMSSREKRPQAPAAAPRSATQATPQRAAILVSETVVVVQKRRWPWVVAAGVLGYLFGREAK